MNELLINYKEQVLLVLSFIYIPFLAFLISLAAVYIFGRMFNILKSTNAKNFLAIAVMIGVYVFYFCKYNPSFNLEQRIWYMIIYTAISCILYVLIGFKLYDRVDGFLDKKVGPDKEEVVKEVVKEIEKEMTDQPKKRVKHGNKKNITRRVS